jgi:D-alanyl-D-alanine-carboxypeptidase/D-alanyl-D-alanine-endopeptidase
MTFKLSRRLSLLLAFAPSLHLAPAVAQTPPPLPTLQSAAALGQELYQRSGSVGMVLVVVRGNQVFVHGYGETAPGSGRVPDNESIIRLCSLTKIFTTDLLTKLAADKTVRLDDTLARYAPPHAVVPANILPITLEDLATHTSGLPREVGTGPRGTPHFTYPDYQTRWRWLATQHLKTIPGSAALYSNIAYDFLSDALQSAAHKPYARLLAERTLNPLKTYETTYYPSPSQCARLLQSIGNEGPCTITEQTEGSSGLYSTPHDMGIWLKYLLGTEVPVLPSQNHAAQAVYLLPANLKSEQGLDHAGTPTGIGLGWMHLLPPGDPSHIIQKTGGGAGFTTYIAISQPRKTAIFLAATDGRREDRDFSLFKSANNLLLTMAGLPPLPPEPPKLVPRHIRVHAKRRIAHTPSTKPRHTRRHSR